ncbi:Conserved_hypothetical protein [Hexamita inflata]|uniref:Transmembrane protein n=1 Tax=Hexamita inflata TaxID=28002 RepID=A0AA86R8G4_9EUKA|nr:Conserved hypothetical protein [Hexamita inflata]
MINVALILADLLQNEKLELQDCYTPASNIKLISINGQRSFRISLSPTNKTECSQLPRGVNVTVYATGLVYGNGSFVPVSQIVFDFSYETTVGIQIQCTQCLDDTYFASDQVIVTIESQIHFARVVMGAVQAERGLQLDCFKNVFSVLDLDNLALFTEPSGNCPQLNSLLVPGSMLEVESMDFFIVYDNRDIDRFEKLKVGSELSLSNQPPLSSGQTIFNINIPKMNVKGISTWILYFEFHIYFKSAVPVIANIQSAFISYSLFAGAFQEVKLTIQKNAFYLDFYLNTAQVSFPPFSGPLSDYYNSQINTKQPNKCVLELVGFSASIPPELQLKDNFITKITNQVPRIAQMAFDLDTNYFQFKNERRTFSCEQLRDPIKCLNNLEKLLQMKDPNFLALFQVQFYRDEQLLSAVSTLIFDMKDSCFLKADGFVQQNGINVIFEQHADSKYCKLVEGQQVDFELNITGAQKTSIVNSQLKFSYNVSLQLTSEQVAEILDIVAKQSINKLIVTAVIKENGNIIDQITLDNVYKSDLTQFELNAKLCIVAISVASVLICVLISAIPLIQQRCKLMFKRQVKTIAYVNEDEL